MIFTVILIKFLFVSFLRGSQLKSCNFDAIVGGDSELNALKPSDEDTDQLHVSRIEANNEAKTARPHEDLWPRNLHQGSVIKRTWCGPGFRSLA